MTQIADVVVPAIFTPYSMAETMQRSVLMQSGAVVASSELATLLSGGGSTFNAPFFNDLTTGESNVSSDEYDGVNDSTPNKIGTGTEIQVRQARNNSWTNTDLTTALAGADPMQAIASRVGAYWARDVEASFVATMKGVFADNAAAPTGSEHVQDDLTVDLSTLNTSTYLAGTTDIGSGVVIDTLSTMGDAMGEIALMMVHSVVYSRLLKQDLITFIKPSDGSSRIATYLDKQIVMSDQMPFAAGVYETWMFGRGAVAYGQSAPDNATEVQRLPAAGNGGGQDVLYNRVNRIIHPVGHAYVGAAVKGGPANSLQATAASWQRVFPERKQIPIARLITREHA